MPRYAIQLSLAVGLLMLLGKAAAYYITGSSAILADTSESLIHNIGVAFAAYSVWLSARPANSRYLFGYERIAFFSAGFEGALISMAGMAIIYLAVDRWRHGIVIENLSAGTLLTLAASVVNLALGFYLIRTGKKTHSLILEANGRHVLTDSWTSFGAVGGLLLVIFTGWKPFDPLAAILLALVILWSGASLMWKAITGLLDYADPETSRQLRELLDTICRELDLRYHDLRFRFTGQRLLVQVHLLFPFQTPIGEAHRRATLLEQRLARSTGMPTEVDTHLEAIEDHSEVHG
jgi:cation diffusion facilitator family transporter